MTSAGATGEGSRWIGSRSVGRQVQCSEMAQVLSELNTSGMEVLQKSIFEMLLSNGRTHVEH